MQLKKILISTLIMAIIYLVVSYLFSLFFQREFLWPPRILGALAFGIFVTLLQVFLAKKKKRSK